MFPIERCPKLRSGENRASSDSFSPQIDSVNYKPISYYLIFDFIIFAIPLSPKISYTLLERIFSRPGAVQTKYKHLLPEEIASILLL